MAIFLRGTGQNLVITVRFDSIIAILATSKEIWKSVLFMNVKVFLVEVVLFGRFMVSSEQFVATFSGTVICASSVWLRFLPIKL